MRSWARARIGAMVGASGTLVMVAIGIAEGGLLWYDLPLVACAFSGATAAGLILAPLFGRGGRGGALRAALGAVVATLAGASLGGAAALGLQNPLAGLALGPLFVAATILSSPLVALTWIVTMLLAHLAARPIRRGEHAPSRPLVPDMPPGARGV